MPQISAELVLSVLISCLLFALGAFCLVWQGMKRRRADLGELAPDDRVYFERQFRRRRQGSLLLMLAGVLIFIAQGLVDYERSPRLFGWLWVGVLLTLLWTVVLSWVDLAAIMRYARRNWQNLSDDRRKALRRAIAEHHARGNGSAGQPPNRDTES